MTAKSSFFFLTLTSFNYSDLVPGEFASIFQVKQISMIAKELQKREVIFLNDVLVAVSVAVAVLVS